ncbi:MAG: elongation factor P [Candidatus Yonathbacteria bacterium]|nr:elongation factor P [Candidatus Yonathbacteria bacterium]
MLDYNELTVGTYFVMDGQPYEVVFSQTAKKNRQKATNQTKVRNMISGKTIDKTFHQSDSFDEAVIEKTNIVYIYRDPRKNEYWFRNEDDAKSRFTLPTETVADKLLFVKENSTLEALVFGRDDDAKVIGINPPVKVDLKVTEATPAVRGNTAQNATQEVTVETGATINVPMFIEQGNVIRINTQTKSYVERA